MNINSVRNKVDMLSYTIGNKIDNLMISESKLNDTFQTSQFVIDNFTEPFKLDRTRNGVVYYFMLKITWHQHCWLIALPEDIEPLRKWNKKN